MEKREQVPSWKVTHEMLEEWGFPVERLDHCVGSKVIIKDGMTFGKALNEAWKAGFVRQETDPQHDEKQEALKAACHARNEQNFKNVPAIVAAINNKELS